MSKEFDYPRDFKGIWLPKEIWLDDMLNTTDKVIFAEIDSLDVEGSDGCYASNEYLSKFCKCSVTKVSTSISKLIKLGYIKVAKTDGRTRWLKASLSKFESQNNKNKKSESQKMKESNINNKNTLDNSKDNSFFPKKVINQDDFIIHIHKVVKKLQEEVLNENQANNLEQFFIYFIERYAEIFERKHPFLSSKTLHSISADLTQYTYIDHDKFVTHFDPLVSDFLEDDSYKSVVDLYFETKFKKDIDCSLAHFCQKNVLTKLMGHDTSRLWFTNES